MNITEWHTKAKSVSLKESDIVRVREDLVPGERYGGTYFTEDMVYFRGVATRIEHVEKIDDGSEHHYHLSADDSEYDWSREMLSFAGKEDLKRNKQLVIGSWVRIANADMLYAWCKQHDFTDEGIDNTLDFAGKEGVISYINYNRETYQVNIAGYEHSTVWPRGLITPIYKDWYVYEIGERVLIRPDIKTGKEYDAGCMCVARMEHCRGKFSKITRIYRDNRFQLEITGDSCWWSPGMLMPAYGD